MEKTDYQLIKKIKKDNCSDSFKELSSRHCKLFYSVCNKYVSPNKIPDIHSDLDFVFLKSVNSYKTNKKAKFSTWLANCTRYHCLNYSKNENKYVDLHGEETVNTIFNARAIENYDNEKYKNEIDHVFNILGDLKDKRIVRIFKMRYLYTDMKRPTWKKIGERFELTSQTIINLHDKGRAVIKRKFNKDK